MFPNPYNVYLHDTPSHDLFNRSQRTFSHGCIRISKPIELAEYLLKGDQRWTRDAILTASTSGRERIVQLPEEVPVHIVYWTAWVAEDGAVNFRNDIYERDKPLLRRLYSI
jgi:murein L,D-transpeptidase YcbB/YkuD